MKKTVRIEHFGKVYSISKKKFVKWLDEWLAKQSDISTGQSKFVYELSDDFKETKIACSDSSIPYYKRRIKTTRIRLGHVDIEYAEFLKNSFPKKET